MFNSLSNKKKSNPSSKDPKPSNKSSFISFGANINGEFNNELLETVVSWMLSISIVGGSVYGLTTMLLSPNTELEKPASQPELVEPSVDSSQSTL